MTDHATSELVQQELEKYEVGEVEINELRKQMEPLLELDITEAPEYNRLATGLRAVVKVRTGIDKRRKELKAPVLEVGRAIEAEGKRLTAKVLEIEGPLARKKAHYDAEIERAARELENRLEALRGLPVAVQGENLSDLRIRKGLVEADELDKDYFGDRYEEAVKLKIAGLSAIQTAIDEAEKAEQERLDFEFQKEEQEAQAKRLREKQAELDRREAEQNQREETLKLGEETVGVAAEAPAPETASDNTTFVPEAGRVATNPDFLSWVSQYLIHNYPDVYDEVTDAHLHSTGLDAPEEWQVL